MVRAWKEANKPARRGVQAAEAAPAEPAALPPAVQRVIDALSVAIGKAVTEAEEAERRRARLAADAAVAAAMEQVAEAQKLAADEREATEAVRREVGELQAVVAAKDLEITRLSGLLSERDGMLAGLRTEAAVFEQKAASERERAERAEAGRTEAELAAREAVGRAAKAEGETCGTPD